MFRKTAEIEPEIEKSIDEQIITPKMKRIGIR